MIDSTIVEVRDISLDALKRLVDCNNRLQVEVEALRAENARYLDALHVIRNALPVTSHMPAIRAIKPILQDTIGQCEPDEAGAE